LNQTGLTLEKTHNRDTIAAISTPFGESGIGIVRLSGPLAEVISSRVFRPRGKTAALTSHRFRYGEIIDPGTGQPIDEALIVLMRAPRTYTKEDIVEIHCHGGYLILEKVLETVISQGARMADPGEFTRRAFLNDRIDLTQAEAVIDLIEAKTMASLEIANRQLKGTLYQEMMRFKERLTDQLALIEAQIDFPDEIEPLSQAGMRENLEAMICKLGEWIASYEEGKILRQGISCAIIGKTNVGKSSILNILLREERAIVTAVPGTTRDVIEEVLNIHGIPVRLMDTAGLRKTADSVEQEGVRRTREKIEDADLILFVVDGSRKLDEDDEEILRKIGRKKTVIVLNKKDLPLEIFPGALKRLADEAQAQMIPISALNNEGIDHLKAAIYSAVMKNQVKSSAGQLILTNVRHKTALLEAKTDLLNAVRELEAGNSPEFVAFEIRMALEAIGELVGETTTEEVLDRIFSRFCIGK